jgi:hypothetical protein
VDDASAPRGRETACVHQPFFVTGAGRGLAAFALIVSVLAAVAGVLIGGAYYLTSAVAHGAREEVVLSGSKEFGSCLGHSPWSCQSVPFGTVEAKFGRQVKPGWTILSAEAEPVASVSAASQIQVVFEAPAGADVSSWLSLADQVDHHDTAVSAPLLDDLGVTSIDGGSDGFTKVFTGEADGHTYVWAYKHL